MATQLCHVASCSKSERQQLQKCNCWWRRNMYMEYSASMLIQNGWWLWGWSETGIVWKMVKLMYITLCVLYVLRRETYPQRFSSRTCRGKKPRFTWKMTKRGVVVVGKNLWSQVAQVLTGWHPSCHPTNSVKALKGTYVIRNVDEIDSKSFFFVSWFLFLDKGSEWRTLPTVEQSYRRSVTSRHK